MYIVSMEEAKPLFAGSMYSSGQPHELWRYAAWSRSWLGHLVSLLSSDVLCALFPCVPNTANNSSMEMKLVNICKVIINKAIVYTCHENDKLKKSITDDFMRLPLS